MGITQRNWLVYLLCIFYAIGISFACSIQLEWMGLLPIAIVVMTMAIIQPKNILLIIAFATPLSLNLENLGSFGGIGFYLPTEPLLFGLLILILIKAFGKFRFGREIWGHPITIVIIIQLFWILITSLTSSLPIVSLKFFISRLWFVIPCFILAAYFFKDLKYLKKFLAAYLLGMSVVLIRTLYAHAATGFNEEIAHYIMSPFFKDHTSYGAVLALFIPLLIIALIKKRILILPKPLLVFITTLFLIGLFLSYTRAAWLSLIMAIGVAVIMVLRVRFSVVLLTSILLIGSFFFFQDQLIISLERNRQDSSGDIREHIQSITNISSDASNLERLNRWNSAIRMWDEKPVMGWGPGTYMFQYAPFQKTNEKTIISTNRGDMGNAHSEYLGPLSEQGLPGFLIMILLVIVTFNTAIRLYYRCENPEKKAIILAVILGLVTYLGHGVLNNFLDTDKAGVPFWAFLAIILAIDIGEKKRLKETTT